jgi:hypothetical protein
MGNVMTARHHEERAEQSTPRIHGVRDKYRVHWTDRLDAARHLSLGFTKETVALSYARALVKTGHQNVRVYKNGIEIAADKLAIFCLGEGGLGQ